jgi:hypothetical protein
MIFYIIYATTLLITNINSIQERNTREIIQQDYNIEFLGNNFDKIVLEINKKPKDLLTLVNIY